MQPHWIYLILINACSLLLMRMDKRNAEKKKWRIPEATLLLTALLGGSLGGTAGMFLFRHKTRKPLFLIGFPVLLLLHLLFLLI